MLVAAATRAVSAFRGWVGASDEASATPSLVAPEARTDSAVHAAPSITLPDSLRGKSGALKFATLTAAEAASFPGFVETFGEEAIHTSGAQMLRQGADSFALITLMPFAEKRGGLVNGYRLGEWPAERWLMARNYFNPDGFVEVMPSNASLALSRHFVLGDFVTHDQQSRWPKYVVLEEKLIDKLELVLRELVQAGHRADRVVVLSGFRAPYYNERGSGEGMARASRHQYGDAADIIIDSNGDGQMDDLNGDRRLDLRDVGPITSAIERIEQQYPEFVGGLGTYSAMGPRGPFAHVDVRGTSARWEEAARARGASPQTRQDD
jgi:uncharacterized protein YcbK (DUF882 family)